MFTIMLLEADPARAHLFRERFSALGQIRTYTRLAYATNRLRQGEAIDLIVVRQEPGLAAFLTETLTERSARQTATIVLQPIENPELNRQGRGEPIIDWLPNNYDHELLLKRIDYFRQKRAYAPPEPESRDKQSFRIPVWKRAFDIAFSVLLLLLTAPVLLLTALLIWLDSRGPIFYRSKRVGMGYRVFDMYKFRTMRVGADRLIKTMATENNMYGSTEPVLPMDSICETCELLGTPCQRPLFQDGMQVCELRIQQARSGQARFVKIQEDPRVTRLGHWLRNLSIDELPQLFNILIGDMSVVGNRPLPLYEAEKLTMANAVQRFAAPGGLTGLWQVSKRGHADVADAERIELDVRYAQTFSLKTDLKILLRTFGALIQKANV